MRFRATILQGDKTATGIHIPPEIVAGLGSSKRPPVRVTINRYTYRSSVAVLGGEFMLGVSADVRQAAGVAGAIRSMSRSSSTPRRARCRCRPTSRRRSQLSPRRGPPFEALNYSNQKRIVLGIEGAKAAETRQRRIEKAITDLREGRVQL